MPYAFHLEIATDRSVQLKRAIPRDGSCAHRERKGALRQIGVGKKTRRKRGRGGERKPVEERENVDQPELKIYRERKAMTPCPFWPTLPASDAFILENAPRTFYRNLERINMERPLELEAEL